MSRYVSSRCSKQALALNSCQVIALPMNCGVTILCESTSQGLARLTPPKRVTAPDVFQRLTGLRSDSFERGHARHLAIKPQWSSSSSRGGDYCMSAIRAETKEVFGSSRGISELSTKLRPAAKYVLPGRERNAH